MSHDRIPPVDNTGIITPFIEHPHIQPQYICQIDGAVRTTFVRADGHHVIAVDLQVLDCAQKALDELIGGGDRLKSVQRDCVLHTRIMSVKGNDIVHSHAYQLLQGKGTVQRLPSIALMLTALIEERHDDIDPPALAADGRDHPLQILKMVVR